MLKKIAVIESDLNPSLINRNKNGTADYGIMQINSCHFDELAKYGINQNNILSPRVNITAGAILIKARLKDGYKYSQIGTYHSNTPIYKEIWNAKLEKELSGLK